eukprot:74472-Prymnesium_polylepis.1
MMRSSRKPRRESQRALHGLPFHTSRATPPGRWPMMSPGGGVGSLRYARPAVPLARDTCR